MVDEDTELLDPIFQNGGQQNPQLTPSRNVNGSQKGKPDVPSKDLEENITTEKKTDSSGRISSLFPKKPSDDIIDLDIGSSPKKPSVGIPLLPKIPLSPRTSTDSNKPREETEEETRTVSPIPHGIPITTQSTTQFDHGTKHEGKGKQPDKERPGIVTIVSRDGNLVLGSDGKTYRLQRGPPGRMGPPGQEVSLSIQLLCFDAVNVCWAK